jgi:hypothetical protein
MPRRSQADPKLFEQLRLQILRRAGWRFQICGSMRQLEVHHQLFGSHGGQDIERNLTTRCNACHAELHRAPCSRQIRISAWIKPEPGYLRPKK